MRRALALAAIAAMCAFAVPAAHAAGPQLHVSILVDRTTALPGDVIHYLVVVENLGDTDAGVVRVTSHYPARTTAAGQNCPQGTITPSGDLCLDPDVPVPGLGDQAHQVDHSQNGLAPGATFTVRFAVQVDADAPLGTHLPDHAHASSATAPEVTSAPVDTLVVATVPNAVFGSGGVAASGQTVTDSWDSSAGSPAQTTELRDGDLASNGDITLSGASLVNGDATPGPGHRVILTESARVTGSTAPATTAVVLDDVDATPYAGNNDDHRICRASGSCAGTTFDPVTKTLVVGGSATLPTGAYFLCRLDVSGVLRIAGTVTVWFGPPSVCGQPASVWFGSTGSVTIGSGDTRDLQLRIEGPGTVKVTSFSSLTGIVDAPDGSLAIDGHGALLGDATVGSAALSGQALVHIDRSLAH